MARSSGLITPLFNHERDCAVNTSVFPGSKTIVFMGSIASRLKEAREEKHWTQAKLATLAKVSQATVGNIEAGLRMGLGSLPRLADVLGVRHNWLRDGELPKHPEAPPMPEGIRSIAEEFERREVPDHARQTIMAILSALPLKEEPARKSQAKQAAMPTGDARKVAGANATGNEGGSKRLGKSTGLPRRASLRR